MFDQHQLAAAAKGAGNTVLLQGMHALKHAWRFGAVFEALYLAQEKQEAIFATLRQLGEDAFVAFLQKNARPLPEAMLAPFLKEAATPLLALAHKPQPKELPEGAILFLENPSSIYNLGAVIRTAAAAGVVAIYSSGVHEPWNAGTLRTAAGLHFALTAVAQTSLEEVLAVAKASSRPIFAFSAEGENIYEQSIPAHSLLIFGTEREGLSPEAKAAGTLVSLPMRPGVSSLNLAASVAAALYGAGIPRQAVSFGK